MKLFAIFAGFFAVASAGNMGRGRGMSMQQVRMVICQRSCNMQLNRMQRQNRRKMQMCINNCARRFRG